MSAPQEGDHSLCDGCGKIYPPGVTCICPQKKLKERVERLERFALALDPNLWYLSEEP